MLLRIIGKISAALCLVKPCVDSLKMSSLQTKDKNRLIHLHTNFCKLLLLRCLVEPIFTFVYTTNALTDVLIQVKSKTNYSYYIIITFTMFIVLQIIIHVGYNTII